MAAIDVRVSRLEQHVEKLRYERETLRGKVGSVGTAVDLTHEAVQVVEGKVDLLHEQVQGLEVKVDGLDVRFDGLETKVDEGFARIDNELAEQRGILEQILRRLPILPIEP